VGPFLAACEAFEHLAPRRDRGQGQEACDLLRRKLPELRPHQLLPLGRGACAELVPHRGRRDRRGLPVPAPGGRSAHGNPLPLDSHAG
jgi:hypothetical protein